MKPEQMKANLISVVNTLNTIEIKGRENMNRMLGSIMLLEKIAQETEHLETSEIADIKIEEVPHEENPAE